jgi:hypothetical protein
MKTLCFLLCTLMLTPCVFAQSQSRFRMALSIYPVSVRNMDRGAMRLITLNIDRTTSLLNGHLSIGAFATSVETTNPQVSEWVAGPRVNYLVTEKRLSAYFGGGLGYGWQQGDPTRSASVLKAKYQVGIGYQVLGPVGVFLEVSNYRNYALTNWGFWPTIGLNARF